MTSRLPSPWEHESGYHLNADGKQIRYTHPESGAEITVESYVDEDYDELRYHVYAFDNERNTLEHPESRGTSDEAWSLAREWAEEHS